MIKKIIEKYKSGAFREMWNETKWLYSYAAKYKWLIVIYIVIGLFATGLALAASLVTKNLINEVLGGKISAAAVALYVFLGLSGIAVSALNRRLSAKISLRVNNEIRADVFGKFISTTWEEVSAFHSGDLLNRINGDVSTVADSVIGWIPSVTIKSAQFIGTIAIICYYDAAMALLSLISIPAAALISSLLLRKMRSYGTKIREAGSELMSFFEESLQNIQTVKAFGLSQSLDGRLAQLQKIYYDTSLEYNALSVKVTSGMSVLGLFVSYLCMGWCIFRLFTGAIDIGTMVLFIQLSSYLSSSISSLISSVPTVISATVSAGRIISVLNLPREEEDESLAAREIADFGEAPEIEFRDVSFGYKNGGKVFSEVNLTVAPGEFAAFVGPSGGGKTTLLRLLLGLVKPQSGKATLSAKGKTTEISSVTRRIFTYVPQEKAMFSGTVAEMLRLFSPEATDEEINAALKAACAYDFVAALPEGINTPLGERGAGFSEGQNQRLAIARAVLRKAPVLLLDEATSALDLETERRVLENITALCRGKTLIVMTHRESVLPLCDSVYRISGGKVEKVR
ncbi:MAG: ABC transporter ATP-binding protein/permease [Oscillospiraceae bacterium]|nr:ABC transporter ATP-binding protein/permease [Oscillospiraceae bacterium]